MCKHTITGWLISGLLLFSQYINAQTNTPSEWEEAATEIVESGDEEEKDWSSSLQDLSYLKENPFNLNRITKEQLELFPFLTELQIEHFLYYIYVNGAMKTIYELQLVEDWDRQTIQYILPYVFVGEPETKKRMLRWRDYWKYGRNECIGRFDIPLYLKEGYKHPIDNLLTNHVTKESKRYLGAPYATTLRYSFHYKDELYAGLTASKDAGEPFFNSVNNKGYDAYSFYFLAHNLGKIKTLAIGNYRLNFGEGIVINSDYSLGKSVSIATLSSKSTGIKRHSSSDEYNYFQGVATTLQFKDVQLSAFYSHRTLDGKVSDGILTTIKKDGMHRLPADFERKNAAIMQLVGTNLSYSMNRFKVGLTAIYYFLNKEYIPESRPYNYYNIQGKCFYNVGINYKYRWKKFAFEGETALSVGGGKATMNTVSFSPISGYQLLILQRYYAKDYKALYARSICEGTGVQNENGYYMGIEAKPIKYWKFFAYADFFYFPWLRYGVSAPSSGFDGLIQVTYTPRTNLMLSVTYQHKVKDKDYTLQEEKKKEVRPYNQQRLKCQFGYQMSENLFFKTSLHWSWSGVKDAPAEHGTLFMQSLSYRFAKLPFCIDSYYGMFDTSNYSVRISAYEKGLLYALSVPSFYGKGVRFALNMRYDISRKMMMMLKFGQTRYTDRDMIGTGLECIESNVKSDINILFRCKF